MRKFFLIGLTLLCSPVWGASHKKFLDIKDFHCGLDSYHSPLQIDDCFVQDSLNVFYDKTSGFEKRKGFTVAFSSKSYSFSGSWAYTDAANNSWLIVRTSDTIMATNGTGATTFNVKIATVAASDTVNASTAFGNIYFVDRTQGVYYWNGSATTYVPGSPKGSLIAQFHGRLWISGLAVPNGNYLYASKYLDGSTWATGVVSTDPVLFQIGLQDNFDNITALFPGFNDTLYVFKNYSVNSVQGFDQTDFQARIVNTEVGCVDQRTIQPIFGGLVFASLRGFEFFDGYTASRISNPVKNLVDIAISNPFSAHAWTQAQKTDFDAGTISGTNALSTSISNGDVVLSTFGVTYSTGVYGITITTGNIVPYNFDTSDNRSHWLSSGTVSIAYSSIFNADCGTIFLSYGSAGTQAQYIFPTGSLNSFAFEVLDANTYALISSTTLPTSTAHCSADYYTVSISTPDVGRLVRLRMHLRNGGTDSMWYSSDTYRIGTSATIVYANASSGPYPSGNYGLLWEFPYMTWSSSATDTGFTAPYYVNSSFPIYSSYPDSAENGAISYRLQQSSSSTGAWSDIATSTTTSAQATKEWLRVITNTFNDPNLTATVSTGTYYSVVNNDPNLTSWSTFSANDATNGGTLTYFTRASTNSFTQTSSTPSWVSQTKNSSVTASTGTYFQARVDFAVTNGTQAPTVNDFTFNWYDGTPRPPMASAIYDNRYWVSLTTSTTDAANEATLVLSNGPVWTLFSHHAGTFILWKNSLYHGDSDATGKFYLDDVGYNDNGGAINAYVRTKDFAPQGLIDDKFFDTLYIIAENLGAYNITNSYFVDRMSTEYSLGNMPENENLGLLLSYTRFPIDSSHQIFGKAISFKFKQSDVDAPFKFYGASLQYRDRPPQ